MFIGESLRSLTVDFRAVSQNPTAGGADEVRISEYAGRIMRNWYVVLISVVVAVLLVVLHTSAPASCLRDRRPSTLDSRSSRRWAGRRSRTRWPPTDHRPGLPAHLRRHKAAAEAASSRARCSRTTQRDGAVRQLDRKDDRANPNIQITGGPWDKKTVVTAVTSLGDS
jgi:hypothetical protein